MSVSVELSRYRDGGKSKVAEEGRCRMCERAQHIRRLTRHHVVPKRWFNEKMYRFAQAGPFFDMEQWTRMWKLRDAEANIVPLCEPCHVAVETDEAARSMLRKVLAVEEAAFTVAVCGEAWFNERYPRLGWIAAAGAVACAGPEGGGR